MLYGVGTSHGLPAIRVWDCTVPTNPISYDQMLCDGSELFNMSDDVIYAGLPTHLKKFRIQPTGGISLEDSLSFNQFVQYDDYPLLFESVIEYNDNDYALGYFDAEYYPWEYPVLFYRQHDMQDACISQLHRGKFLYALQNHLYSIGDQLTVYTLSDGLIPHNGAPLFNDFMFRDPVTYVGYDHFLIVGYASSNRIVIFDISNPDVPVVSAIIQQNFTPLDMCLAGDILYVANGDYGIAAYDLSDLTSIEDEEITPAVSTFKAYPNPFADKLTFAFELKQPEPVTLKLFNVKGQLVKTIETGIMDKGLNNLQWDGRDYSGKECAGGVYLARLVSSQHTAVKKIIKLK
jgi:hypothetical protein